MDSYKDTTKYFLFFLGFYFLQGILSFFFDFFPHIWDSSAAVLVLAFFFYLDSKVRFSKYVPLYIGLGFLLHIIGLYNIIPYDHSIIGNLYGFPLLNYHYDLIVHFVGMFFFSLAFCFAFYPYFKKGFRSNWIIYPMIVFVMLGIGSFNETLLYT